MQSKARVLFVDDEERIVNLLRLMFRTTYEVFTATSGEQALALVRSQVIHVIVSDQRMPGMPGIDLLAQVARDSPDTVRLLLTGYSDLDAIVGSVNRGEVFRFLSKPWSQDEMRATLAEAVEVALLGARARAPSPAEPEAAAARQPGMLVLDDSAADREQIVRALARDYRLYPASSVAEALRVLERQDIGVMVCEAQVGNEDTGDLLHVLKNHFPAIITVMLTHSADSDLVIRLINQARIYRFATKPIRPTVLQLAVSAAMKEHQRCLSDARHVAWQRTVRRPHLEPSMARWILQGLKAMTARWRVFSV
jgi:DNA-binding NtrC family response regulator